MHFFCCCCFEPAVHVLPSTPQPSHRGSWRLVPRLRTCMHQLLQAINFSTTTPKHLSCTRCARLPPTTAPTTLRFNLIRQNRFNSERVSLCAEDPRQSSLPVACKFSKPQKPTNRMSDHHCQELNPSEKPPAGPLQGQRGAKALSLTATALDPP